MREPIPGREGDLASALRRAFEEAGNPSLAAVAHAAPGVSKQRLSDWRAGRHVPARFEDLEPVIAYLRITASGITTAEGSDVEAVVTDWTPERWHEAWRRSVDVPAAVQSAGDVAASKRVDAVDRKPVAIAVVSVIVVLVAALAVMAFLLSWATM
ncbi:hypothetical protein MTP03_43580 [Tsukamurella sp. PLM1]|nr:hypothetical protein MTP03_43580 [Tsukamurella sp. PLM1]